MMIPNEQEPSKRESNRCLSAGRQLTPAFSLEGWRERTDARRGKGVFDKVVAGMERLRKAGVPYGMSLTATCENAEEILSNEFMDYFYKEQGVIYSWIFHTWRMARSVSLNSDAFPATAPVVWLRSWE
jgi:MoaA/NifB/PqqE/SkfB family radical SAM enzyme